MTKEPIKKDGWDKASTLAAVVAAITAVVTLFAGSGQGGCSASSDDEAADVRSVQYQDGQATEAAGGGEPKDVAGETAEGVDAKQWVSLADLQPFEGGDNPEATSEDYHGNRYHEAFIFRVSSSPDSMRSYTRVYVNPGYERFAGTLYLPTTKQQGERVVQFVIAADGEEIYSSSDIGAATDPVEFDVALNGAKELRITCYYVKGATDVIGAGGWAKGVLANARLYDVGE